MKYLLFFLIERKDETDKEVIEMKKNCEVFGKRLKDHVQTQASVVQQKKQKLHFDAAEINFEGFTLGKVEIRSKDSSNNLTDDEFFEERIETYEVQFKPVIKRNISAPINKKTKQISHSIGIKITGKDRLKSIIDSKKTQGLKLIGREGLDDGEFRHPLGKEKSKAEVLFI